MPTPLTVVQEFPAAPSAVYALMTDRAFLEGRLADCGGENPEILGLEPTDGGVTVTTQQSIPASVLPPMVASMLAGNPVTQRTEKWTADGDGYVADFSVTVKGAPASLKGTMALTPATGGSTLTVQANASVPIPMFGGKIEDVIVGQIGELLAMEADYTREQLGG